MAKSGANDRLPRVSGGAKSGYLQRQWKYATLLESLVSAARSLPGNNYVTNEELPLYFTVVQFNVSNVMRMKKKFKWLHKRSGSSSEKFMGRIFLLVLAGLAGLGAGCNYAAIDEAAASSTTAEKVGPYQLFLKTEYSEYAHRLAFHPSQTWLSLSYAPVENIEIPDVDVVLGAHRKVRPSRTPWAPALERETIILRMNDILTSNGVDSVHVRVRMIAHAIVASGWKQKVWNFNAWGVRQGSWEKEWYVMPTYEENDDGSMEYVADASWRAFSGWEEAILDFQERISAESERPSYREAYRHLVAETVSPRTSRAYWEALSEGNYYTATWFTGEKFARLCGGVRGVLKNHKSQRL